MLTKEYKGGNFRIFAVPAEPQAFEKSVFRLDELLEAGPLLKDSCTTTAGIVEIPGFPGKVFLKRTNNKNFFFTLRYLFRRARAFRAAETAFHLLEKGIMTPIVLAVGEQRVFLRLKAGYLITEALPDAVPGERSGNPGRAIELLRKIHDAGVFHGDAKIQNFYELNGKWGVWDLDGSCCFRTGIPGKKRLYDLARLALSLSKFDLSNLADVCKTAAESYGDFSGKQLEQIASARFSSHFRKG